MLHGFSCSRTLVVRGMFCHLEFPYAHFGTQGVSGDLLLPIVEEVISRLEFRGVKVISITADGASSNRKMFRLYAVKMISPYHSRQGILTLLTASAGSTILLIPPYLIKTTRNCWANSGPSGTRHMQVTSVR